MQERDHQDQLLDLRPQHTRAPLDQTPHFGDLDPAARDRELAYLRLISARQVRLPDDAYFAAARGKIRQRVTLRKITLWDRLVAAVIPETLRPVPVAVGVAAIAVAIMLSVVYYPYGSIPESRIASGNFGPYVSLAETYTEQVAAGEPGGLSPQELKEYREILLMSTAILGSPSSLSRSRSLAFSGQ